MENRSTPYRRAKTWHVALSQMTGITQMAFYILMTYATYIGNLGYGIAAVVVGIIMTASRFFDGITDPICAFMIERFRSKWGKLRFFLIVGWALMALSTTAMCCWGSTKLSGVGGLFFFIACYFFYILGYTFVSCSSAMSGNLLTNDPKQRPTIAIWSTVYSYLAPMLISMVLITILLPKFGTPTGEEGNYNYTTTFLAISNWVVIGVSFVSLILTCIGIAPYDKMKNYESLKSNKEGKVTFKDMWSLLKDNKELRRYIVAASSDKLAQTIGSQSIITTLLFGVLLGSIVGSSIVSVIAMLPSIIFVIIGARLAGKQGNKKVMVNWTWLCIIWNLLFAIYLMFVPAKGAQSFNIWLVIFFLLMLGNNAFKMVVSSATGAMRMDVVDYEMYRSNNFLPATVSAVYSFVDKVVSALAPTLASLLIMTVGYAYDAVPQNGDPLTMGIRILIVVLFCGFPILGWICTILAMRKFSLTKEKMEEIQLAIASKKEALEKGTSSEREEGEELAIEEEVKEEITPNSKE